MVRIPVFDRHGKVWGYELSVRDGESRAGAALLAAGACRLAAGLFLIPNPEDRALPLLMVRFAPRAVVEEAPHALPCDGVMLVISPRDEPTPEYVHALRGLRLEGYRLALDGYDPASANPEFFRLADMVIRPMPASDRPGVPSLPAEAVAGGKLILARGVDTHEQYALAKAVGFSLFQGAFFKGPEVMEGKILPSQAVSRLKIFQFIEREDATLDMVAESISLDVSLSYRLLQQLNSPAFGLGRPVTSIKEAMLLAGWTRLRNWVRAVILADMKLPSKTCELPLLAVQRAHFLEQAGLIVPGAPSPDALFLLGLFSLLDAMLDMPMDQIVDRLPLDAQTRAALCGEPNVYGDWLEVVQAFEAGAWERLDQDAAAVGLEPFAAARLYYQSLAWASGFFQA